MTARTAERTPGPITSTHSHRIAPLSTSAGFWTLASLSLPTMLSSLGTSIANVGLPAIAGAFGAPFAQVKWIVLSYLLAVTTLIAFAGRLGDLLGRRRLLLAGIGVFTVASLVCGVAPGLWLLIAARAAQGLGAAVMMALALAIAGEAVPKERTGSAMGLLGSASAAATALGPSLGGLLIAGLGWRALFLVNVPLGIGALLLAHQHLPADGRRTLRADLRGFDLGGVLPLVWRDRPLSKGLATSTLVSTVLMGTLVVGPFYLSRALGLDAVRVGLVISLGPFVAAVTGVPAGRLVDRVGSRRATSAGLLAMAAGCLALSLSPVSLGVTGYAAPLAVVTAGYALFQAANNTAVLLGVAAGQRGVVSGLLNLSRNLGLVAGTSLVGSVFARQAVDIATASPDVVAHGTRVTFSVAVALIAAALVVHLVGGREVDGGWFRRARQQPHLA